MYRARQGLLVRASDNGSPYLGTASPELHLVQDPILASEWVGGRVSE